MNTIQIYFLCEKRVFENGGIFIGIFEISIVFIVLNYFFGGFFAVFWWTISFEFY